VPKLNLTDDQKEMLRKGYRRAQALPASLNMGWWAARSSGAPCGTVCCYAGELLIANGARTPKSLLSDEADEVMRIPGEAEEVLGLPSESLYYVFRVEMWPSKERDAYCAARDSSNPQKERADILARVVERFIELDGETCNW
jgi:hypothetical protein